MRFRIAQCLCGPNRHAILAMAMADDTLTDAEVRLSIRTIVEMMITGRGDELLLGMPQRQHPWCGICGARSEAWVIEVGWSIEYPDWDTARRALKASEAEQHATRALLDLLDLSYDATRRREDEAIH